MYVVVQCPKCHQHTMAKVNQKTRICPYCNTRIIIANHTKRSNLTAKNAVELVKHYNDKQHRSGLGKWLTD